MNLTPDLGRFSLLVCFAFIMINDGEQIYLILLCRFRDSCSD
jgi:hypothetical protein